MFKILTQGVKIWEDVFEQIFSKWEKKKHDLLEKEHELKTRMHPHVRQIVETKQILLYKQMLQSIKYPDCKVADLMYQGFPIVGDMDITGVFEQRQEQDVIQGADPIWLLKQAKLVRKTLIQEIERTPNDHILKSLYSKTVDDEDSEVRRKWASGPFSETELVKRQGPLCLPCRRFGVEQGEDEEGRPKVRPIDDFSENFHNSCVTMVDKISVTGIDGIANLSNYGESASGEPNKTEPGASR